MRFGLKLGLTYGKLIPTPGQGNVCPLTPAWARYGSSDGAKKLERREEMESEKRKKTNTPVVIC